MQSLVWYASYGSNLLKSRFLCYIRGGTPEGASKNYKGCTDKSEPIDDKPIIIPYKLYFSKRSSVWENKGVSFIKTQKNENAETLGRMYLITRQQFNEIMRQENDKEPINSKINIDFNSTIIQVFSIISVNWYNRIIYLGSEKEYPIFTFTLNLKPEEIKLNPPGDKYLSTIIKGIKETYELSNGEIFEYIHNLDGVKHLIEESRIKALLSSV